MADNELKILLKMKDEASKQLDGFKGKLAKMSGTLKGVGIGMAAVGTAAIGMGIASVKQFADAGDEVQKMALKTGFSTEALSELRHAADLSGTSLTGLGTGLRKMSTFVVDVKDNLSTATDTLDRLGLSASDIEGLAPEEMFNKLTMAISAIEDPLIKADAAQQIFGKTGTDMLPMLADGAEGLAAMRQEAHDLGLVFDQEAADSAANMNDSITRLQGAFTGLMNQIAKALIPVIEPLIKVFTELVKALPIDEIAELIGSLLPPLAKILVELFDAIPFELMVKFVMSVLKPVMTLLKGILSLLSPILTLLEPIFMILTLVMELITPIIEGLAWILGKVGAGLGVVTGGLSSAVGSLFGGASGAIVTKPTYSLVGEAGPEAIIPLSRAPGASPLGGGNTTVNITVEGSVLTERDLAETVRRELLLVSNRNYSTGLV